MKNVEVKVVGDILTLTIDLSQNFGPTASGKSVTIASSVGNYKLADTGIVIGLNIYKPLPAGG